MSNVAIHILLAALGAYRSKIIVAGEGETCLVSSSNLRVSNTPQEEGEQTLNGRSFQPLIAISCILETFFFWSR